MRSVTCALCGDTAHVWHYVPGPTGCVLAGEPVRLGEPTIAVCTRCYEREKVKEK